MGIILIILVIVGFMYIAAKRNVCFRCYDNRCSTCIHNKNIAYVRSKYEPKPEPKESVWDIPVDVKDLGEVINSLSAEEFRELCTIVKPRSYDDSKH